MAGDGREAVVSHAIVQGLTRLGAEDGGDVGSDGVTWLVRVELVLRVRPRGVLDDGVYDPRRVDFDLDQPRASVGGGGGDGGGGAILLLSRARDGGGGR